MMLRKNNTSITSETHNLFTVQAQTLFSFRHAKTFLFDHKGNTNFVAPSTCQKIISKAKSLGVISRPIKQSVVRSTYNYI